MDEIINIFRNEMNEYNENIKLINKKINYIKDIYFFIKPKGKDFSVEQASLIALDDDMFSRFVDIIEKNNYIAISHMILYRNQYERYLDETDRMLNEVGLNREILFSDNFSRICKSRMNQKSYENFESLKENDIKLKKMNRDIILYCCDVVINIYESLLKEKEIKKDNYKLIERIYKKLRGKKELDYKEISAIIELISSMELDDIKTGYLLKQLNIYIRSFNIKKEEKTVEDKKDIKLINKIYTDDTLEKNIKEKEVIKEVEENKHRKFDNYIDVLLLIDNYEDLVSFLDSISYMDDFDEMISYVIEITEDNDIYIKLNIFLKKYISLNKEEEKCSDDKDICLLYYGFNENKNRILDDISSIPEEYYGDINKAIELIKTDGAYSKRTSANKNEIKKVFKIRVNDIRVTFKRISKDVYIILGIFVKKDYHGNRIISTTKKRNYNLLEQEVSILDLFSDDSMKDEALNINSKMEDDILSTLSMRKIDKK